MADEPAVNDFPTLVQRIRRMLAPITAEERKLASESVNAGEVSAESRVAAQEAMRRAGSDRAPDHDA